MMQTLAQTIQIFYMEFPLAPEVNNQCTFEQQGTATMEY